MESPLVNDMSVGSQILTRAIPPDAREILLVDCTDRPTAEIIAGQYERINPHGHMVRLPNRELSEAAIEGVRQGGVDCVLMVGVSFDSAPHGALRGLVATLKDGGVFLAAIDEARNHAEVVQMLANAGLVVFRTDRLRDLTAPCNEHSPDLAGVLVRAMRGSSRPVPLAIHTHLSAPRCCAHVRVFEPNQFTETVPGVSHSVSLMKGRLRDPDVPQKVFIWQRTFLNTAAEREQQRELIRRGFLTVAEIDDHPLRYTEYRATNGFFFRACHCVQTSTEPLANYLRQFNPHVAVFRNQLAELPELRVSATEKAVVFFGALNRYFDWQDIMPAINGVIHRLGRAALSFQVVHDRSFFDALEMPRKTFTPLCDYDNYLRILGECDLAILPLRPHTANDAKSDLKFLECAGYGVVALASPTVYEHSVQHRETGFLYRSPDEFASTLRELILRHDERRRIAANAYYWVKTERLLCLHYQQRVHWYRKMLANLPVLTAELKGRAVDMWGLHPVP